MNWKELIVLRQNDVDPSPEARASLQKALDAGFKFAEYALISGLFTFLAFKTEHWAVIVMAIALAGLLWVQTLSLISGFVWFNWRAAPNPSLKALLLVADSFLFFVPYFIVQRGMFAILQAFSEGIGV